MGHKAAETTRNINNAFGSGTANKRILQGWFKKFCRGDQSLEDEECSGWPSEVDNDQPKTIIKADLLKTTWEVVQPRPFYSCLALEANRKDEKAQLSGCLMSWPQIKKWSFWSVVCSYSMQQQQTISWLDYDMWRKVDFIWQLVITSGWTKKKLQSASQSQTCTKRKVIVIVWWFAAHLTHYSFLNPSETITTEKYAQQINETHWELQSLQPALVNRKGSILLNDKACPHVTQAMLQKLNKLGNKVLPYSPDLSPTDYHFFKHLDNFLQGKHFHNQWEAENVFQEFVESWSMDIYATGTKKLISHWKKCVDCNHSYFG